MPAYLMKKFWVLLAISLFLMPITVWATEDDDFIDAIDFSQYSRNLDSNNVILTKDGYTLQNNAENGYLIDTIYSKIEFNAISVSWKANLPENTNLKVELSVAAYADNWSDWKTIEESDLDLTWQGQYFSAYRYRITLSSKTVEKPVIHNITFSYNAIFDVELGENETVDAEAVRGSVSKPAVTSRSAWGARSPNGSYTSHTPKKITIHHTYQPTAANYRGATSIRQIQNYHMDSNGWMDIGYHFLIGTYPSSGETTIFQGRPETVVGAHTGGANTNNVGVNVVGDYTYEKLHSNSYKALIHLLAWLCNHYGISPNNIYRHMDFNATACPGNNIANIIEKIRTDVKNYNGGGNNTQTGTLIGAIYDAAQGTSARISGATVKLNTGATTKTSSTGIYTFTLPPATYTITVSKSGYKTATSKETVVANQEAWESIPLKK